MFLFPRGNKPQRNPVLLRGPSPEGFILNAGWLPNACATRLFDFRWAAVEPGRPDFEAIVASEFEMNPHHVCPDFEWLLRRVQDEMMEGDLSASPIIFDGTPSHLHKRGIVAAADLKLPYYWTDKPPVVEIDEVDEVYAALKRSRMSLMVTFNHQFNAIVEFLRVLVRKERKRVKRIYAAFIQDWLQKKVQFRQADWRTSHIFCALLDILTHAGDLASCVAGSPIILVEKGKVREHGEFAKQKGFFDEAEGNIVFANGLEAAIECSQCRAGHADDIYIVVELDDDTLLMWSLEWNPDALFVSKIPDASFDDPGDWDMHLRGHSSIFADLIGTEDAGKVMQMFGKNPGGHIQGWDSLWYYLFAAGVGSILRKEHHTVTKTLEGMQPIMHHSVPMFADAGAQATILVHALYLSATRHGKRVLLTEVYDWQQKSRELGLAASA